MPYLGVRPADITSATQVETDKLIVDNVQVDGNTISSTDTNGDITLDPNGTGDVNVSSTVDISGSSGATLKLTSTDTTGADTELLGQIDFVSSDSSTGSAGTQARIQGVYEDNGDSSGIAFLAGASTGSGTPTISEVMRIRHEGNVGIGTSSPTQNLDVSGTGNQAIAITSTDSGDTSINFADTDNNIGKLTYQHSSNTMLFRVNDAERMRIDDNGRLLLRKTSGTTSGSCVEMERDMQSGVAMEINDTDSSGTNNAIHFRRGGSVVGKITIGDSSTGYVTSSDYRLKENVANMTGAIDRVKALAPKRFNFIVDADTTVDGFLAHEAQTVVPEAVTGTKDEVDDDGNAVMQGIDQSKLVPLLTAALKESIAKIETLETEMTSLKARVTALEDE